MKVTSRQQPRRRPQIARNVTDAGFRFRSAYFWRIGGLICESILAFDRKCIFVDPRRPADTIALAILVSDVFLFIRASGSIE